MSPRDSSEIVRGTLDLLILEALSLEPMHGWSIAHRLEQLSSDALRIGAGSLYPALQRLQERGLLVSKWGVTEENRRAKYYELTAAGRNALGDESRNWQEYVKMVEAILGAT
jgi:transcriptional regulator